jgi:tol-pal system protein YbgF
MVLRRGFGLSLLLAASAWSGLAGCWFVTTKKEGKKLERELASVQKRQAKMERQREELEQALIKSRADQKKLSAVLERARKVLLRNSADLGAKVQVLEAQIGKVLGRLDNVERDLETLATVGKKKREQMLEVIKAIRTDLDAFKKQVAEWRKKPSEPEGPDALFGAAQKKYRLGVYPLARKYFQQFADRYPNDKRAELAVYQIAESYYKENKFGAAVYKFRHYLSKYPKGKHAPEAWLKRAKCHLELKYCKSAIKLLSQLRKKFPKTTQAREAARLIKKTKRMVGNPRYCSD